MISSSYSNGNQILLDLQSHDEMKELLILAGPVTVDVVSYIEGGFDGEVCLGIMKRTIKIKKMGAAEQRGALIFELTNVANRYLLLSRNADLRLGLYKSAEEYARATEEIEFKGVITTLEIEKKINEKLGVKFINSLFSNIPEEVIQKKDFETYYKNHLSKNHIIFARNVWNKKNGFPLESNEISNMQLVFTTLSVFFISLFIFWNFRTIANTKFL